MSYTTQTQSTTLSAHKNLLIAIGTAVMHAAEARETTWVFAQNENTWRLAAYVDGNQQLRIVTRTGK